MYHANTPHNISMYEALCTLLSPCSMYYFVYGSWFVSINYFQMLYGLSKLGIFFAGVDAFDGYLINHMHFVGLLSIDFK